MSDTGRTTSREKRRTGEVTRSFSLSSSFPPEIHKWAKARASRGQTVEATYSNAISSLRGEYDSGIGFIPQGLGNETRGKSIKIWLTEKAHKDLGFLAVEIDCHKSTIVHTAMLRWMGRHK